MDFEAVRVERAAARREFQVFNGPVGRVGQGSGNDRPGDVRRWDNYGRNPRLENAVFLRRDLFQSVAEKALMIVADRRDDTQIRTYHIGCVQSSTQADLEHGSIHLVL